MFRLSKTLEYHSSDVKAVSFVKDERVVSVGRDGVAYICPPGDALFRGDGFLNSVHSDGSKVYIGAQNSTISSIDLVTGQELMYLGHEGNITSLDVLDTASSGPLLASGSWDYTARVWQSPEKFVEFKGHDHFVWGVCFAGPSKLITASADKTIGVWDVSTGKRLAKITGHTDVVRGVCAISADLFASCSNDLTVRIWSLDTYECIRVLQGHTSFVYSVVYSVHDNALLSSGEDRSIRIWDVDSGECRQTITLPCVSVWNVAVNTANGDFAVGSSDHKVRIFTKASDRFASKAELDEFDSQVASSSIGEDQVGIVDDSKLSDPKIIESPGHKEGQIAMIKPHPHGPVQVHQYSTVSGWSKIGDVVQGAGTNGKKSEFEGAFYDYVFDVDIADDRPPLKLPFNNSDNIYVAAEQFLERNALPTTYREDVVQFLLRNTQTTSTIQNGSAPTNVASAPAPAPASVSRSTNVPATDGILSYNKPLAIEAHQAPALAKAFRQAAVTENDKIHSEIDILTLLSSLPSSSEELLRIAMTCVESWSLPSKLPALDLLRLAIPGAPTVPDLQILVIVMGCIEVEYPKHALLAVRGLANLLSRYNARDLVSKQTAALQQALDLVANFRHTQLSPPFALATATLCLNLVVLDYTGSGLEEILVWLTKSLALTPSDVLKEARYRLGLAIGVRLARTPSQSTQLAATKQWFQSADNEERFKELTTRVLPLFS